MERIPKIVHFAWFGRGEMGSEAKRCIESWKKFLPEYEFKEWNEDTFDLNRFQYAKEAYENRKFAYVADVVRLYALYEYGGIYMDTDVEVVKPFGEMLEHHGFSSFESDSGIPTGTIASEPKNQWVKDQLDYYETAVFSVDEINSKHLTNVDIITGISLKKHGLIPNGKKQELKYGMMMYPVDFFCAKSPSTGIVTKTENTYTIHHFAGSWVPAKAKRHKKIFQLVCKFLGKKNASRLLAKVRK